MQASYVRPMFVIGDSHSGSLNGLLLRNVATGEPVAVGEAWCVHGLSARSAIDDAGDLHPAVIAALAGFHLLTSLPYDHDVAQPRLKLGDRHFVASSIARTTPILFIAGELDAREVIASIPPGAETVLPFPADLSGLAPAGTGPTLPAPILQARIIATFRPLFGMLQKLKALGIERIALASLPPPTAVDEEYARLTGIACSARTRYAVHLFANAMMRTFCAQSKMLFIDTWTQVTDANVAKPDIFVDGIHLGHDAARTVLETFRTLAHEPYAA